MYDLTLITNEARLPTREDLRSHGIPRSVNGYVGTSDHQLEASEMKFFHVDIAHSLLDMQQRMVECHNFRYLLRDLKGPNHVSILRGVVFFVNNNELWLKVGPAALVQTHVTEHIPYSNSFVLNKATGFVHTSSFIR